MEKLNFTYLYRTLKVGLLLAIIILQSNYAFSQIKTKGIPFIRHYTKDDYNAATQNWSIAQDQQNIMFFANSYGVLEFDGNYWRIFNIPNNIIVRTVKSNPDGKLYVGGQGNVGYYCADSAGSFIYHSLLKEIASTGQNISDVWNIFFLPDQLVVHANEGLFVISKTGTRFYKSDQLYANAFQIGNEIYISDINRGMQVFDGERLKGIPDSLAFKGLNVTSMFEVGRNKILVATNRNGLYNYENNKLTAWQNPANKFLKDNQIYCGTKISVKNPNTSYPYTEYFAFGTIQNGLLITDKAGNPVQHINKEKGLQNNTVLNIFYDANGNLWLALDKGIDFVEISSPFSLFSDITGFPGTIYALEFQNDKIYVGTNQGVFIKNRSEIENVLDYNSKVTLIPGTEGQVWSLFHAGKSLLCGHHEGVFQLDGAKAEKVISTRGAWCFNPISDNQLIVGQYAGISNLNLKVNKSSPDFLQKIKGFDESSRIIEIDSKDSSLWIAHGYKGIYHLFLDKERKNVLKTLFYTDKNGLPSYMLNSVFKIDNEIVFGTTNGVYKYDALKDTFVPHPVFSKYLGNGQHIRKMFEDNFGNIWLSINKDIGVLIRNGDGEYSFQTNQFKRIAGRLVDGFELIKVVDKENVFFGTYDGLIHYAPQINKETAVPFHTLVRKVSFFGEKQHVAYRGYAIKGSEKSTLKDFTEKYAQNSVRIQYSASFYEDCRNNSYRYKLEGYDKDWSEWTSKTEKEYTNLSEGSYTFLVHSMNIYSTLSDTATFQFVILPPWHRTNVAYGFYFVLLIFVLILGTYLIYLRFRKQRKSLQEEKRKAIADKVSDFKKVVEISEKEIIKLQNEKLEAENSRKNTELASYAMQIMQKNEMLELLRLKLNDVAKNSNEDAQKQLENLVKQIEKESYVNEDDEKFEKHFDEVHNQFLARLAIKYPDLTPKEHKMCAYLRMNLSSKEIAPLLKITISGVEKSRYRIRKKLNLLKDENLLDFLLKF